MVNALNFKRMATAAMTVAVIAACSIVFAASVAQAGVVVTVDKSAQRLTVSVNGTRRYDWPVSTARWGYRTPNGVYRPQRLERQWYSRKYHWSPMPHSIFFNGGYAIHGSYEISRLGTPASHGCIRLHPQNAATLFALVKANAGNTEIVVSGSGPQSVPVVARRRHAPAVVETRRRTRVTVQSRRGTTVVVTERPSRARKFRAAQTFEEVFVDPPIYTGSVRYNRRNWR